MEHVLPLTAVAFAVGHIPIGDKDALILHTPVGIVVGTALHRTGNQRAAVDDGTAHLGKEIRFLLPSVILLIAATMSPISGCFHLYVSQITGGFIVKGTVVLFALDKHFYSFQRRLYEAHMLSVSGVFCPFPMGAATVMASRPQWAVSF